MVIFFGLVLYSIDPSSRHLHNLRVVFGGGVVCLFFWTIVLVLSQFYRLEKVNGTPDEQLPPPPPPYVTSPNVAHSEFIEPGHGQQLAPPPLTQYEKKQETEMNPV